jgi:hypothetical protein
MTHDERCKDELSVGSKMDISKKREFKTSNVLRKEIREQAPLLYM